MVPDPKVEEWLQVILDARSPSAEILNKLLLHELGPYLATPKQTEAQNSKPLLLRLRPPFGQDIPDRIALYAFKATQHVSERQRGTFKIQLTHVSRDGRHKFSRAEGWPFLVGVIPDLACYVIWDATMYDRGLGFTYSRSVQVNQSVVRSALLTGAGIGSRQVRVGGTATDCPVAIPVGRLIAGLGIAYAQIIERHTNG